MIYLFHVTWLSVSLQVNFFFFFGADIAVSFVSKEKVEARQLAKTAQ